MTRKRNIMLSLVIREIGVKNSLRCAFNIVNTLVCSEHMKYVRVWEKHSRKSVSHEGGRLYFDTYKTCYTVGGFKGLPSRLYQLPATQSKIEEAIICQGPLELSSLPDTHLAYRHSFVALNTDNWLIRFDLDNGKMLQKVYLSQRYKFRHLSWDSDEYTLVVKSTHNTTSTVAREAGIVAAPLLALAVFTIFPLEFVGLVEIGQSKEIFGHDLRDAMLSQGTLITLHQGGLVRLYSFERILQQGLTGHKKLYEPLTPGGDDHIGTFPWGLPANIKITGKPELLFEVKCLHHNLSLGGTPWHYIISPPGSCGYFKVYCLRDQKLAEDGYLDIEGASVEPDKCIFHPDDSGKILHIGTREIHVLQIKEKDCPDHGLPLTRVHKLYSIEPFQPLPLVSPHLCEYTSSGRAVKRAHSYFSDMVQDNYEHIQTVDYEDDLDLLYISVVAQVEDQLDSTVHLYDNISGKLVKQISLEEPWKEFCDHIISIDLDSMVHIVKGPMNKFSCYVYRLQRQSEQKTSSESAQHRKKTVDYVNKSLASEGTGRRSQRRRQHVSYVNDLLDVT